MGRASFFGFGAQLNGRLGYRCILSWFAACRGVLTSQDLAGFGCRPALRAVASLLQAKNLAPALVSSCRGLFTSRMGRASFFGFGAQLNGRLGYRCILSWFAACRGVLTSQDLAGFGCRPALRAVASLLQAKNLAPALVSSCRGLFTSRGDEVKFFGLDGRFASAGEKLHLVPNLFNPWRAGCGRGGHRPSGGLRSRAGWLWGR